MVLDVPSPAGDGRPWGRTRRLNGPVGLWCARGASGPPRPSADTG